MKEGCVVKSRNKSGGREIFVGSSWSRWLPDVFFFRNHQFKEDSGSSRWRTECLNNVRTGAGVNCGE
jgi:hypothetical protein